MRRNNLVFMFRLLICRLPSTTSSPSRASLVNVRPGFAQLLLRHQHRPPTVTAPTRANIHLRCRYVTIQDSKTLAVFLKCSRIIPASCNTVDPVPNVRTCAYICIISQAWRDILSTDFSIKQSATRALLSPQTSHTESVLKCEQKVEQSFLSFP